MIKKLQALRARKGFTIIELIVVVAILALLAAIILPMISVRDSKIREANSAARDFYTVMQTIMTKYNLYEAPLSPAYQADPKLGEMRYFDKMGGNYPYVKGSAAEDIPNSTSIYIEVAARNSYITEIYTNAIEHEDGEDISEGLYNLCKRPTAMKDTEFGKLLKAEIENRLKFQDGFYYAKVTYRNILTSTIPQKMEAETLKVEYTGYSNKRLPEVKTAEFNTYKNANFYFGEDNVLVNGDVFGVCAPLNTDTGTIVGMAGTNLN